jgi:uncharacterized protein (DUF1778 family)
VNQSGGNIWRFSSWANPTGPLSHAAVVVPEDEFRFREESAAPLSDRDRDKFLDLLDNPPKANSALRRAATKHPKRHE